MKFKNVEIKNINTIVFLRKGKWIRKGEHWEKEYPTPRSKPISHEDMMRKIQVIDNDIVFRKWYDSDEGGTLNIVKRFPAILYYTDNRIRFKIFETESDCNAFCQKHDLVYDKFSGKHIRKMCNHEHCVHSHN